MKAKNLWILIASMAIALTGIAQAQETVPTQPQKVVDVYDTLAAGGQYKTLVKLIDQAGLKDTFKSPGEKDQGWTLFAPSDEAFAKLPKAVFDKLTADPKLIRQTLLYHVLPGKVKFSELTDGQTPKTNQGDTVKISVKDEGTFVNGAKIVQPDGSATNGLVHTVDIVLLPKSVADIVTKDGG